MKTSNRSYPMAMLAGLAIIGAATAGVSIAESHQAEAAAEVPAAPAVPATQPSSDPAAAGAVSAPPASAGETTDAASPAAAGTASAAVPPSTAAGVTGTSSAGTPAGTTASGSQTPGKTAKSPATSTAATSTAATSAPATSAAPATSSAPAKPVTHMFKDGQYSATGMYNSPGGTQHLGVTITVAADTVTAAKVDLLGNPGIAHSYQTLFASGYSTQVVGKNIASIKLGAVAGSSLTGIGFNMALQQIESQAHA
ncbi:MAG: hypothetical protein M3Y77_15960 [Actinomycetota bacterium]|nr:hypothetical protein [Actinomycetota bacterium]